MPVELLKQNFPFLLELNRIGTWRLQKTFIYPHSQRLKSLVATVRGGQTTEAPVILEESVTEARESNTHSQFQAEEDNPQLMS